MNEYSDEDESEYSNEDEYIKKEIFITNENIYEIINNIDINDKNIKFSFDFDLKILSNHKLFFNKYANSLIAIYSDKIGDFKNADKYYIKSYLLGLNIIENKYKYDQIKFDLLIKNNELNQKICNHKLNNIIYHKLFKK